MTAINPPFVLTNVGATHTAENDRTSIGALLTGASTAGSLIARGGVAPALGGGLAVTVNTGLTVNIAAGVAFVAGNQGSKQGVYICTNDATTTVTLDTAHATLPRIDIIVAKVEDTQYSGAIDAWSIVKVTGTAASSPTAPSAPSNAIILAQVTVPAAAVSLVSGNIADVRNFIGQGVVPCKSTNKPPLTSVAEGTALVLTDTGEIQVKYAGAYVTRSYSQPLVDVQRFTSSGTWTKPSNAKSVWVRAVGGGGGGGGCTGAGSGQSEGGGGGGGGYCESLIDASTLGATVSVTVGTGGAGGINGTTDGSAGTNTVFSGMTAGGGGGGVAGGTSGTGSVYSNGGSGGTATGGSVLNIVGGAGSGGRTLSGASVVLGRGGSSHFSSESAATASAGGNGNPGVAYGGGGAGAFATSTTRVGGAGAAGIVIVYTFF